MGKRSSVGGLVGALTAVAVAMVAPATALGAASATTYAPTNVTNNAATLHGQASSSAPASYAYFQYGPTSNPDANTTPMVPLDSGRAQNISANVSGLTPETTYTYRMVVVPEAAPEPAYGNPVTFTTLASPSTIATTGQATDLTPSSGELNGVANTTSGDSSWYFQWGRTTSYGHQTRTMHIGQGFTLVAARIGGLRPKTRYHFRLVVLQDSQAPADGNDSSFKTKKPVGHARLSTRRLAVTNGVVAVSFRCKGARGAPCKGRVSLSTRSGHRTVGCGSGRLSSRAPHGKTVQLRVGSACSKLVGNAHDGRLAASLRVVFSTFQPTLRASVTLLRR